MQTLKLKSLEFRKEREASWRELEELLERIERRGLRALTPPELARLPLLYRSALSSLSVARSISLDRNVIDYLEALCQRAYFNVYGIKRHLREAVAEFFGYRFPAAVRALRWHILIAALALTLGTVTGFMLTNSDEERFYSFVAVEYAQGRDPTATTAELREVLYDTGHESGALSTFASTLFSNNARVGILAFCVGFLAGLPVFYLMFTNGLILGAFASLYHGRGLSLDLWGWLLPHGVTELSAVALCGGAGLVLAQALLFPGRLSRIDNLSRRGREAGQVVMGAVVMFFVAALIEGIFRQTVTDIAARYIVATTSLVLWVLYFALVGRARERGPR